MEAQFTQLEQALPVTKSAGGRDVASARNLWEWLEVQTEFPKWFARRTEEYGFKEGVDFLPILAESTGGRPLTDFVVTTDTAKELAMVERTERGRIARQYFIWTEKRLRETVAAPSALPTDFATALRLLADSVEEKARLQAQIEAAAPKVEFFDAVAVSSNAVSFAQAAKWLKVPGLTGRNKLIQRLKADGILMQNREPYQQHIDAGRFEVQPQTYAAGVDGAKGKRLASTTRVTGRGLEWLARRYRQAA